MQLSKTKPYEIIELLENSEEFPLALDQYPSRGQTSVQKLYHTKIGKLFLKKVSERNHQECRINVSSATLAERESWAYRLATELGLQVPEMALLDKSTTIQRWLDIPDAHHFITNQGPLTLEAPNVFECACFDWLTGQIDRHDANYLYDFVNQKIILVDSAHAFLKYEGSLPHYLQMFEVGASKQLKLNQDRKFLKRLSRLQKHLEELIPLRDSEELQALKNRAEQCLNLSNVQSVVQLYRKGNIYA